MSGRSSHQFDRSLIRVDFVVVIDLAITDQHRRSGVRQASAYDLSNGLGYKIRLDSNATTFMATHIHSANRYLASVPQLTTTPAHASPTDTPIPKQKLMTPESAPGSSSEDCTTPIALSKVNCAPL